MAKDKATTNMEATLRQAKEQAQEIRKAQTDIKREVLKHWKQTGK